MIQEGLPHQNAAPGRDHVEHARRQSGVVADPRERERRERRGARRLQDDRATRREGGSDLPGDHGGWEVPRRDGAHDPDRLLEHPQALVGNRRRNDLSVDAAGLFGEPAEVGGGERDLALRFLERLAVLLGDEPRQAVAPLGHQIVDAPQDPSALDGGTGGPCGKGPGRFVDRPPHVLPSSVRQLR